MAIAEVLMTQYYMHQQESGETVKVPKLTSPEKSLFTQLAQRAGKAVSLYNGCRQGRKEFIEAVSALEFFAKPYAAKTGIVIDTLVSAFNEQSRPWDKTAFSIQELWRQAHFNLRGPDHEPSGYDTFFENLDNVDAHVRQVSKSILPDISAAATSSDYQPKLLTVIDALYDEGITVEEMKFFTAPAKSLQRDEYLLILLEHSKLQIAVCDRSNAPVFIMKNAGTQKTPTTSKFWSSSQFPRSNFDMIGALTDTNLDSLGQKIAEALYMEGKDIASTYKVDPGFFQKRKPVKDTLSPA